MEKTLSSITTQVQDLLDQAYACRGHDLERSLTLAEQALDISKESDHTHCVGKSLCLLSLFHMIIGDFDLSINMAKESIEHFEKVNDEKGIADAKYTIAGALYKTDDFNQGLTYLIDCLKTYKKLGDHHNMARAQKSMGTIYEYFEDIKSAIQIYEGAIESAKNAKDLNLESNAYNPLSGIYLNDGKIDKAMEMIEKSISLKKQTGDTRGLAFALYGRGKIFLKTNKTELSEKDFLESIRIHEEMGEKLGKAMCFHKLGALYIQTKRLVEAKAILIKALEYSNKNRIILIKFRANLLLHDIAKLEGDFELALKYLGQYIEEKESVINEKAAKLIESYDVITKMHGLELEAIAQKEKADIIEKKNIELDSFFYRISHDLKGPITSMMSLSYLAKIEVKDETANKFLTEYEGQATRLNAILDGLLTLTKMSFNTDSKQDIDFEKVIYDCISSYKFLDNFSSVQFKIKVEEDIAFNAEWSLVNTILQNLIENGIKYARIENNKPEIAIEISSSKENIHISVKDNGIGMSEETQSKIFKMFFRANRKIQGTGLGLHILNRALEKLDGEVKIESELGVGSTFIVTLAR